MKNTFLAKTVRMAARLQVRYNKLGAAGTQRVRNYLPLHKLILTVLPTLPAPNDLVEVSAKVTTTILGRKFSRTLNRLEFASTILDKQTWDKALTVEEVCNALTKKGFMVHPLSVRQMLCNANGITLGSVSTPSNGRRGRPLSRYFVRQNA